MSSRLKTALACVLVVWACLAGPALSSDRVMIFAAASTAPAIEEIGARLGLPWVVVPASSGTLARQIDAGAEADLFISANPAWMEFLAQRGHLPFDSHIILHNRLVLAAPALSQWSCELPCDTLLENLDGRPFAICDPAHAPCGQYAEQALKHLGLWDRVSGMMIRGTSAQLTLNWIALGEAGAGIVYASDVLSSEKVRIVDLLPEDSHAPIQYRIARLSEREAARQAEADLMSDAAAEVFSRFGFILPSPAEAPE